MLFQVKQFQLTAKLCHILYHYIIIIGAVVPQLASVWLSELEVPSSILGDLNVCFDFPLICVAIALNAHKMEH